MIGIGILIALVSVMYFSFAKAAGMADRRLEEIQRLTAKREVGDLNGN
ncbi:MAG: hypothetical protein K2I03_05115 [Lachnospiraceae bacterium]|nr:hypothetical protein [Lachnospiraceae bacterium]